MHDNIIQFIYCVIICTLISIRADNYCDALMHYVAIPAGTQTFSKRLKTFKITFRIDSECPFIEL